MLTAKIKSKEAYPTHPISIGETFRYDKTYVCFSTDSKTYVYAIETDAPVDVDNRSLVWLVDLKVFDFIKYPTGIHAVKHPVLIPAFGTMFMWEDHQCVCIGMGLNMIYAVKSGQHINSKFKFTTHVLTFNTNDYEWR